MNSESGDKCKCSTNFCTLQRRWEPTDEGWQQMCRVTSPELRNGVLVW